MEENTKKLSYEELENVAAQLQQENMQFRKMVGQMNYTNFFKRLDYLFEVLKLSHMFPQEFVTSCSDEIIGYMNESNSESTNTESVEN